MISYTCSPPGSIIYSTYGHFLSPDEFHLVIVKPHSISYYLTNQVYDSADPDIELPFEATIIGAHMFTLPSRQCSSIALITLDLTLIILSSPFSKEGGQNSEEDDQDIPIERTVCDQIRSTHVIPSKYSPLFASSNNQLFISVYPNSLVVITFSDVSSSVVLEKNEVHFSKFLPKFLYGDSASQKIYSYDTVDDTIKVIDIEKVPSALEEQSYDSSSLLFTEQIAIQKVGKESKVNYFIIQNNQFLIFTENELINQSTGERCELPNKTGVVCVSIVDENNLLISFKNGEFLSFDQTNKQFNQLANLRPFTSIVPIDNDDVMLFSKNEQPLIFNTSQKIVKFAFSNLIVNSLSHIVVPHSVPGLDQLLVSDRDEIVSYGDGYPFNTNTITAFNGGRLFMIDDIILVSTHDQTVVLNRLDGEDVSSTNSCFETNDTTIGFFKTTSNWYIQCCSKKIIAVNSNDMKTTVIHDIEIQHATFSIQTNSIIIASNSLSIVKFDGNSFTVSMNIEINDEISSICICKEKFLIVSLWKNLAVFVYNLENGQKLNEFNFNQSTTKFVVRSICESQGFVFFGTSRGEVICTTLNESNGELIEVCHSRVSTSTINLSSIEINGCQFVCVSSDTTSLVSVSSDNVLFVYPTNLGSTRFVIQSNVEKKEGDENLVAVLSDSNVLLGDFGSKRVIRINKKKLDSRILKLIPINSTFSAALLRNELVVIDHHLPLEIVEIVSLSEDYNYTNCCSFVLDENEETIVAICAGMKTIEENKFSEDGRVIFVKNFNEIVESSTISTKGLPTAVTFSNGALFVAAGPTIQRYNVNKDLQFTLAKEAPGMMLASELIVSHHTHPEKGANFFNISIVDAFKSVAVFDFDLHRVATDFLAKYLVAGCNETIHSDKSSSFIVSDSRGGVYLMNVKDDRVVVQSRMSFGEAITGISCWNPIDHKIDLAGEVFCGTTSMGSIVAFFTRISPKLFSSLQKLQNAMEVFLVQNGELSHSDYRSIYSPSYREPFIDYVDANFLAGILDFDDDDRNKILDQNGIDDFEVIHEFLSSLEEFNIQ